MPLPVSVSVLVAAGTRPLGLDIRHIPACPFSPDFTWCIPVPTYPISDHPSWLLAWPFIFTQHRSPASKNKKPNKTIQALAALALRISWMRSPSGCGCLMNDT